MKGITAAGNWILDITKTIDTYPQQDTLANILTQESNNGGAAYNVLKDLSRLEAPFPLYGIGLIGDDASGEYILKDCRKHGINIEGLQILPSKSTSFTDVMLVKTTGRRTFFHHRGANAFLDIEHFNFSVNPTRILHLGYLLLLDQLDTIISPNKTKGSIVLSNAKKNGILTSVDLVSESSDRFRKIVAPSLPFIDYLFLNEYEAGKLTGIDLVSDRTKNKSIHEALKRILSWGVLQWVILHFPEGAIARHRDGQELCQGSVDMPASRIIGTTGAGDAFAAGVLYGLHEGWAMERCLELGVCSAATSLTHASCSNGVLTRAKCLETGLKFGFKAISC
jgi:sugar/nucleoside kinase (ribokinase family)